MTLAEIIARTAERKAAGANQAYPEHAGGAKAVAGPCRHGPGAWTGETVPCRTCKGTVQLKVLACAAHPEGCTPTQKVEGRACCAGCPVRVPSAGAPGPG